MDKARELSSTEQPSKSVAEAVEQRGASAPRKTRRHRSEPDPYAAIVGGRIRAMRKSSGFSFDSFVKETGLGRGYVSELERGLVVPSLTTLAKVARALRLTPADLVVGDSPRERLFTSLRAASDEVIDKLQKQVPASDDSSTAD